MEVKGSSDLQRSSADGTRCKPNAKINGHRACEILCERIRAGPVIDGILFGALLIFYITCTSCTSSSLALHLGLIDPGLVKSVRIRDIRWSFEGMRPKFFDTETSELKLQWPESSATGKQERLMSTFDTPCIDPAGPASLPEPLPLGRSSGESYFGGGGFGAEVLLSAPLLAKGFLICLVFIVLIGVTCIALYMEACVARLGFSAMYLGLGALLAFLGTSIRDQSTAPERKEAVHEQGL